MENAICVVCRYVPEEDFGDVWQDACPNCAHNLGDCWAVLEEFLSAVEVCSDCYDVIAERDECGVVFGAEPHFSKNACPRCMSWDDDAQRHKGGGDRYKVYEHAFEDANWDYQVQATSTGEDGHAVIGVVPFGGVDRFTNKGDASASLMLNLEALKAAGFSEFKVLRVIAEDLEYLEVG